MNIDRKTREELAALSLEVYGTSSKWKKFVETGYVELLTEDINEIVPGVDGAPDTQRTVKTPLRRKDGAYQSVVKYHTIDSIREVMLERREQIAKIKEIQKKLKEQKELNKKVQESAGGSAL